MARKTRRDRLEQYIERVDKCRRWRSDEGLDGDWARLADLYRGNHFSQSATDRCASEQP